MLEALSPPRGPVLDWSSFRVVAAPDRIDGVDDLPQGCYTTSGRAAIYHALLQLGLPPGATVLVPSYHCPTMVAPIPLAGLEVAFYGIGNDGRPLLGSIDAARGAKAIIVPHYFGLPRSLREVREWCDANGVAMIEDCAHAYFGRAGERAVGAWGDFATASLSKFFPLPEAGLLASSRRAVRPPALARPGWLAQVKGAVDVFEKAAMHRRFFGINAALRLVFGLKNAWRARPNPAAPQANGNGGASGLMHYSDMGRIAQAPLAASMLIKSILPRGRIFEVRQRNFALYAAELKELGQGARPLFDGASAGFVPYVFPLWVDDADRVYAALKAQDLPVLRWDMVWPGVPALPGDVGPRWSRHVLQLLCHQDLSAHDVLRTARAIRAALAAPGAPAAGLAR